MNYKITSKMLVSLVEFPFVKTSITFFCTSAQIYTKRIRSAFSEVPSAIENWRNLLRAKSCSSTLLVTRATHNLLDKNLRKSNQNLYKYEYFIAYFTFTFFKIYETYIKNQAKENVSKAFFCYNILFDDFIINLNIETEVNLFVRQSWNHFKVILSFF